MNRELSEHYRFYELLHARNDLEEIAYTYDSKLNKPYVLHFKSGLNKGFNTFEQVMEWLEKNK